MSSGRPKRLALITICNASCTGHCCKPPRYVQYKGTYLPYDGTYGAPEQGQTLDVWESLTTESALRRWTRHIAPRHNLGLCHITILDMFLDTVWESCEKGLANHDHILEWSHMILCKIHPCTPHHSVVLFLSSQLITINQFNTFLFGFTSIIG